MVLWYPAFVAEPNFAISSKFNIEANVTDANNLRDAILAGYRAGNFLETVFSCLTPDDEEREKVALELAALHNDGIIDVVAGFEKLKNNDPNGPDFFLTRRVFEKALPHLDAEVSSVMRCVLRLHRKAGKDLAAGTIFDGFIGFCAKDTSRPAAALKEIEANPDALRDILPATIAAGSQIDNRHYLEQGIRLSQSPDIELRRRAVFSMANLKWPKGMTVPNSAFAALEESAARETDDEILASVVKSAFALFEQDKSQESRAVALIASALPKGGEYTLHGAAVLFGFHTSRLPSPLLDLLLTHLKLVNPEHKGTLDNIDYGLSHLIKTGEHERAIRFLEELLLAYPGKLTLKTFDSAAREILKSGAVMSKILTRWFLRGERTLCEGVHEIAGTHHGDDLRIEIDPAELTSPDFVHVIFIAHKAIGYFFMKPVTAASVVISLMRVAPNDEVLHELGELLLSPLLMNYTGSMREYVAKQAAHESGKVKESIDKALASIEKYLEDLRGVPNLRALHPSQAQRESYRHYMSESMAESMRAAEKQSVFFGLFSRSTLLYGRKSINYIYAGDGQPKRMELPLTNHSVKMEFPRMYNLDPDGVDYMLRVFRLERLRV
jgi:hypothetical protein